MRSAALLVALATLLWSAPLSAHPHDAPPPTGSLFGPDHEVYQRVKWMEERLAKEPDDTLALSSLGGTWLWIARQTTRHADFEKSAAAFERLLKVNPQTTTAGVGLAQARLGQHRFADALTAAQAAVHAQPALPGVLALLGDVHLALGNTTEAALIFEELERTHLTLDSLARVALVRDAQGRSAEARNAMTEAIEAGGLLKAEGEQIAWCESMRGEFAFHAGSLEEASTRYANALRAAPAMHHARFMLARLAAARGDIEAAEHDLIALVAEFPLPRYRVELGRVHLRHGEEADLKAAKELFAAAEAEMAAEVDRGDLGHVRELVEFWLANGGDATRAAELALRELREVRHDPEGFEVAAWSLHKAGRSAEAWAYMQEALTRNPGSARAHWRAAEIQTGLGRTAEADRLAVRAKELNPAIATAGGW
ncbi:MAG: tetratricopeptide repeat protein [Phycisphaerales bacterium]